MPNKKCTIAFHLTLTWLLYNLSLFFVLFATCDCWDRNEWETMASMAVFTVGISVMQYDMWAIRNNRFGAESEQSPE